jgi:hypothetical protein
VTSRGDPCAEFKRALEPARRCRSADPERIIRLEFRPALWLLLAVEVVSLSQGRPRLGKRAFLGLAWSFVPRAWGFLPRKVKLVTGGVAAFALRVLPGSVAALALVLSQLA